MEIGKTIQFARPIRIFVSQFKETIVFPFFGSGNNAHLQSHKFTIIDNRSVSLILAFSISYVVLRVVFRAHLRLLVPWAMQVLSS